MFRELIYVFHGDDAWQAASSAAGAPGGGAGASGGAPEASKISTEKVRKHAWRTMDGVSVLRGGAGSGSLALTLSDLLRAHLSSSVPQPLHAPAPGVPAPFSNVPAHHAHARAYAHAHAHAHACPGK